MQYRKPDFQTISSNISVACQFNHQHPKLHALCIYDMCVTWVRCIGSRNYLCIFIGYYLVRVCDIWYEFMALRLCIMERILVVCLHNVVWCMWIRNKMLSSCIYIATYYSRAYCQPHMWEWRKSNHRSSTPTIWYICIIEILCCYATWPGRHP